jgi:hypothetical protein
MEERLLAQQETLVLSRLESEKEFVFAFHQERSKNFQKTVVLQSEYYLVTVVMRCHFVLQEQHTTRLRLVVNCSLT